MTCGTRPVLVVVLLLVGRSVGRIVVRLYGLWNRSFAMVDRRSCASELYQSVIPEDETKGGTTLPLLSRHDVFTSKRTKTNTPPPSTTTTTTGVLEDKSQNKKRLPSITRRH
jgi:hypothetical protein